jgi:hypothetical protein
MSESNSILNISQDSISDIHTTSSQNFKNDPRTKKLLLYSRDPIGDESIRHGDKILRYCNQNQCLFKSSVTINFRRHLKTQHDINVQSKSSAVQVLDIKEFDDVYINASDNRTKEDLQKSILIDVLNKNVIQKLLIRLFIHHRLSLSLVEDSHFHVFIMTLHSMTLSFISTSHNIVRSHILSI